MPRQELPRFGHKRVTKDSLRPQNTIGKVNSERPIPEIPRVVGIFECAQDAINSTLATDFSFRIQDKPDQPRNVNFLPEEQVLELSWQQDFANSAVFKYLNKAGLPFNFGFQFQTGNTITWMEDRGNIFFSKELFKNLAINPLQIHDKSRLSDTANLLFHNLALAAIRSARIPKVIPDKNPQLLARDIKHLQNLATKRAKSFDPENVDVINDFFEKFSKKASEGKPFWQALGAEVELADSNGRLLLDFANYENTALHYLVNACSKKFEALMKKRFSMWYLPKNIEFNVDYILSQPLDRVLNKLKDMTDMSDPIKFFDAYKSGKIGAEIHRRRTRYKNWRVEKEEKRETSQRLANNLNSAITLEAGKLANLLTQLDPIKQSELLRKIESERIAREERARKVAAEKENQKPILTEAGHEQILSQTHISSAIPEPTRVIKFGTKPAEEMDNEKTDKKPPRRPKRRLLETEDDFE